MPSRSAVIPFALAALAGCTAQNNYDSTQNPFDEPLRPISTPHRTPAPPAQQAPPSPLPGPVSATEAIEPSDDLALAVAAPPETKIQVAQTVGESSPHLQEMIDEANRLGSGGDLAGKSELLQQAGYSGSPKAFYDLARMYLDGTLPKDEPQAIKYISLSHDAGYAEATRVLGMLYLRGQGVPHDVGYGKSLLEAASKSSPRASREYGQLLANLSAPELNDLELGIEYLQDAAERGDSAAPALLVKALQRAGRADEAGAVQVPASTEALPGSTSSGSLKDRALRGNTVAMFSYAQQVMLRKIPSQEPEFTAYCWLAVADRLGSADAAKELSFIRGVRAISDKKNPGRLDQCIHDLHYQIQGMN